MRWVPSSAALRTREAREAERLKAEREAQEEAEREAQEEDKRKEQEALKAREEAKRKFGADAAADSGTDVDDDDFDDFKSTESESLLSPKNQTKKQTNVPPVPVQVKDKPLAGSKTAESDSAPETDVEPDASSAPGTVVETTASTDPDTDPEDPGALVGDSSYIEKDGILFAADGKPFQNIPDAIKVIRAEFPKNEKGRVFKTNKGVYKVKKNEPGLRAYEKVKSGSASSETSQDAGSMTELLPRLRF